MLKYVLQDGRVVKALDLSSNERMSACLWAPVLVNYLFLLFIDIVVSISGRE